MSSAESPTPQERPRRLFQEDRSWLFIVDDKAAWDEVYGAGAVEPKPQSEDSSDLFSTYEEDSD